MSLSLDPEVLRGFLEEARGYLPGLRRALEALLAQPQDAEACEELYRLCHSIGGASRMIGLDELAETAAGLEHVLEPMAEGHLSAGESTLELLANGIARIDELLVLTAPAAPARPDLPEPDLSAIGQDLLRGFLQEADELLQNVGSLLRTLPQPEPDQRATLREIRRSVHTLKGAAAMVGLDTLSRLAHRMEDLLDLLYEGRLDCCEERRQLLTSTYDALCDLARHQGRVGPLRPTLESLFDLYSFALDGQAEEAIPRPAISDPAPPPAPVDIDRSDSTATVRAPLERLDELVRLVGELFVHRSTFERHLSSYSHEVGELTLSLQRLKRLASQLDTEHLAGNAAPSAGGHSGFDALEFDRYTQLQLLSREWNETANDISTAAAQLHQLIGGFDAYLGAQSRLTSEVQDKLVRLRMVPLSSLANRLHRTVRVAAERCGKAVELELEGLGAELDKLVVEQLAGPLEHLLRNAVDHGAEPQELRVATGKPASNTIRVSAVQEGTQVVLRIADDGAGVDVDRIRAAAPRLGFLSEADAASATPDQLFPLVFEPGFSTALEVSELSGRGVGLDVVRHTVESLKGAVTLDSRPGLGATFTITLPTTLAITKVLFLEEQGETFALPLSHVMRVGRIETVQIEQVGQRNVVRLDDGLVPVLRLAELLQENGRQRERDRCALIVLRAAGSRFALAVDRIAGAREVMVKPLAGLLLRSPALAGMTLLGDGSVVPILNPVALSPSWQLAQRARALAPARPVREQRPLNVLIVDDSLSVRRVVANLVKKHGWNPVQAKDGLEALELLQQGGEHPDVILMDIEMPRMDGFELTAALRSQPEFRRTPIVMLTSRAGEKHRSKALSLGATHYMVKPYQEETLLSILRTSAEAAVTGSQVA